MAGDTEKPSADLSLVFKRKGTQTPSSSSSDPSNFPLNEILIEVLQRLPTSKSAFLCKCVCKNWYSLISSPYFRRRFITHRLSFNHQYKQNPSAFIFNSWSHNKPLTFSDEPMFKSRGFELSYLPKRNGSVMVLATFNDLMLCCVHKFQFGGYQFYYYICNPFTMQWVALPLLVPDQDDYNTNVGFVCEPYYSQDDKGECTINSNYRFRVVHLAIVEYQEIVLWTYGSETQQWYRSVLEGSEYGWSSNVVAYNGKLLWYNGERLFAYDPFNPELSTFIDCSCIHSREIWWFSTIYYIGVCRGFLRMMQLLSGDNVQALAIWELKDYTTGEWSLVDQIDGLIPENSLLEQSLDGDNLILQPLGFHPSDGAIAYLQFQTSIISCNTRTRELKMVAEVPGNRFYQERLYRIELPLWPTPIPKRIENLSSS